MRKPSMIALAGAVLTGLALPPTMANAADVTLRLHTFLPPVANPVKHFMMPWSKKELKTQIIIINILLKII